MTRRQRQTLIIFCFTIFCSFLSGQPVQVIRTGTAVTNDKTKAFAFIEEGMDTTKLVFVSTLRCRVGDRYLGLHDLYFALKRKAKDLGANCFRNGGYISNYGILTLHVYFASDSVLEENEGYHEKNVIYLFGSEKKSDKTYSFKINQEKMVITGGTYYRYQNFDGNEVEISKGGFAGARTRIKGKEGKPSTFLTMTGFGLGDSSSYGTAGVSISTGGLNYVENDLGYLLTRVLSKSK